MAQRLPVVGSDDSDWGTILNGFLEVSINSDGTLNTSAVSTAGAEMVANKGAASGYAALNSSSLVPTAQLGSGTASAGSFLRGDSTWVAPTLASDSDVTISSPSTSQVLMYGSGHWANQALGTAAAAAIDITSGDIAALGTQSAGSTGKVADAGHVHPTTGLALLAGAAFTGNVSTTGSVSAGKDITAGVVTLTFGTTISIDASQGNHFRVTLTGNATLSNPTNPTDGQKITVEAIQDATGSRTLAYGTNYAFGTDITSPTLTTTASKRDFLAFTYNSTTTKWYCVGVTHGY